MIQIKLLIAIFFFTIIFLPVPVVLGQEGPLETCPTCDVCPECDECCKGSVINPLGCCETEDACTAPTSKAACELMEGVFYQGDMSCATENRCSKPTAIHLSSFNVSKQDGGNNLISWSTGTEIDTEGFHILRSTSGSGEYSRITLSMITSNGSAFSGGRYSFVDAAVEDGKGYYYKLEEVDSKGNIAHYGPVAAVVMERKETGESQGTKENNPTSLPFSKDGEADPTPVYTIMAYSEGPAKFLSGEVVDEEMVQGIRSQMLEDRNEKVEVRGEKVDKDMERRDSPSGLSDEQDIKREGFTASPASFNFRIIDAEGNEVAVASLETEDNPHAPSFDKGGILKDAKSRDFELQNRWDGGRVILTWHAAKPVKGFHIMRSTAKDGPYRQITKTLIPYIGTGIEGVTGQTFRFTYTDRNVQKGKGYYYKLKPILREDGKTALRQGVVY